MKNLIYKFRILLAALTCLFGVTIFFINSETLCNMIVKVLHLRVDPKFVGGEIAADFFDDSEDDSGSGILIYPSSADFTEGSLDLVRYTVHEPVYDAKWQQNADYWQIDLQFRSGPAHVRNVMIYIGLKEEENPKIEKLISSTETLYESAENIVFSKEIPWNFAVCFCGNQGKVYDAKGNFIVDTENCFENDDKTVKIRIPLKNKKLQKVYTAVETYHYVLVGAYSQYDCGAFMPIEEYRSNSRGGTVNPVDFNPLIPKVYDILGDNQQLATWNKDNRTKAIVNPVTADMKAVSNHNDEEDSIFISEVLNQFAEFEKMSGNGDNGYFGFATLEEAFYHFEKEMNANPESAIPMAYYGSCLAMKGGQSNVVQAVALVNKSFEYMDKAVDLCKNDEELVEVLMNRASVCRSVPESVFSKAQTGAEDYTRLAAIQKNRMKENGLLDDVHEKYRLAYLYISGSQCYRTAGKETESKILLQEAKKTLE